jgi:hypothetical protein
MSTDQRKAIQALERSALDGHQAGQSWRQFFAANVATISATIKANPAGWPTLSERLLHALVTGERSGRLAAGDVDQDEPQAVVVPTISDTATQARLLWSPEATP